MATYDMFPDFNEDPSDEMLAAIPLIQAQILRGLGEATANRKLSLDQLVADPFVVAATILDPRFSTLYFADVPEASLAAARQLIRQKAVNYATRECFLCNACVALCQRIALLHRSLAFAFIGTLPPEAVDRLGSGDSGT